MATATVRNVSESNGWGWHVALWLVQIVLAVLFVMAGGMKLITPMAQLVQTIPWAADVPEMLVRFIGAVEVLGAVGLILPAALRIMPSLTPAAAAGLFVTMLLATIFHLQRGETGMLVMPIALGLLAAFVWWGRAYKVLLKRRQDVDV